MDNRKRFYMDFMGGLFLCLFWVLALLGAGLVIAGDVLGLKVIFAGTLVLLASCITFSKYNQNEQKRY